MTNSHPKKIDIRLSRWKNMLENMENSFTNKIVRIDASESEENILEDIGFALENRS